MANGLLPGTNLLPNDLIAPSGTRIVFHQATAPLGWVTDAAVTGCAVRANAGSAGGTHTGNTDFSTFVGGTGVTAGHSLTTAELAQHAHTITDPQHNHTGVIGVSVNGSVSTVGGGSIIGVQSDGINESIGLSSTGITINNTGSGTAHTHNLTTVFNYIDVLVAQKS